MAPHNAKHRANHSLSNGLFHSNKILFTLNAHHTASFLNYPLGASLNAREIFLGINKHIRLTYLLSVSEISKHPVYQVDKVKKPTKTCRFHAVTDTITFSRKHLAGIYYFVEYLNNRLKLELKTTHL